MPNTSALRSPAARRHAVQSATTPTLQIRSKIKPYTPALGRQLYNAFVSSERSAENARNIDAETFTLIARQENTSKETALRTRIDWAAKVIICECFEHVGSSDLSYVDAIDINRLKMFAEDVQRWSRELAALQTPLRLISKTKTGGVHAKG